ncbi:MAG: hypothetical protein V7K21_16460 [Nostoc sp.]
MLKIEIYGVAYLRDVAATKADLSCLPKFIPLSATPDLLLLPRQEY